MPSSGVQTCALDRKSTRLNSSHTIISYAVFCLKKMVALAGLILTFLGASPSNSAGGVTFAPRQTLSLTFTTQVFQAFFNDTATTEIYPLSLHDALPINDTATTEIYTLSLHDALPISVVAVS